jgi:ribosomal-protein-alanine N-acetyltransferase
MTLAATAQPVFSSMTSADIEDVLALEERAFDDPWNARDFASELKNPRSFVQLLRDGKGELLGHVVFWIVLDQVEILDIAVAPEYRRRGLGGLLMEHVVSLSRQKNCRLISLEVRRSNEAALGLYESLGFKPIALRPRYYAHDNEDAIVMQRPVDEIHGDANGI